MSKSGMLISAPSAPSANGSAASIFGTSDPKLAWRNFTALNSAQAPPGHSTHPGRLVGYPLPVSAERVCLERQPAGQARLTTARHSSTCSTHTASNPAHSEESVQQAVWWLVRGLEAGCCPLTIRSLSIAPVAALWAGEYNKLLEEPAIPSGWNKERTPHTAHRTPDAAPVPERSRPATAHPSAHRKTQIAQRQSGLVLNSRSNVP